MIEKAKLMDDKAMGRAITRISHEIIEKNKRNRRCCFSRYKN